MRIRAVAEWDLDLAVVLAGSLGSWFLRTFVAGFLIATPATISILAQKDLGLEGKIVLTIVSAVFGICAAMAATYHIERID